MTDQNVIAEKGLFRVVAIEDEFSHQPEDQGNISVVLGWSDRNWNNVTESWEGATDVDAIQNAAKELEYDEFVRWVRIFAEDLIDTSKACYGDVELTASVICGHGYSQGEEYMVVQWHPKGEEPVKASECEMLNWARGDAWLLRLEKKVTWSTDDPRFEDRDEWEELETVGGYFVEDPEESEWVKAAAKDMLPDQA